MSPSLSPPPPTPRKIKEEEPSMGEDQDTSSRRSKRKASISIAKAEEPRKRGRPRAGSGVRRGASAGSRFISKSPSRTSISPGPTGRPSMTRLHHPKRSQREVPAPSPLKSPSQTPFSPVPISGTTWLYPAVFPYPVLPPSMTETSNQLKDGRPARRSRKQEFKKGERTSPRPPPMDDLQYSSKVYEMNGLNPHVHRNVPVSGKEGETGPEAAHRGSGSKSADCLNSRHFEREFSLPFFESYIAHADTTEERDNGLEAMVRSVSGEETQKWQELAY
ncbi:hypothetical protein NCC49_005331 [Naganishia albida]|nr:hypothetical protein NCC49_005331 [Naganishia albida]